MLPINARVRPNRSAMAPNVNPPAAADSSVIDPRIPAVGLSRPRSFISADRTSEYNITSNESSIHPSEAASRARRAVGVELVHHARRFCTAAGGGEVLVVSTGYQSV